MNHVEELLDPYLKPWYILLIETANTDKGQQTLHCFWQRPVLDGIVFALGRAVSIGSDVMPYILESVDKELALVQTERYSVLEEYNTGALEEVDQHLRICAPVEDVINDCAAVGNDALMFWVPLAEQRQPFSFQLKHHSCVGCRSIHRSE
jgi:hypothetical protein